MGLLSFCCKIFRWLLKFCERTPPDLNCVLKTTEICNPIISNTNLNFNTTERPNISIADLERYVSDDTFHLNFHVFKSHAPSKPVLNSSYSPNMRYFIHTLRPCTPLCIVYNSNPTLKCLPFDYNNITEKTRKHIAQETFRVQKQIFYGWTIFCCCSTWDQNLGQWIGDHFQIANTLPYNTWLSIVSGAQSSIAYYLTYTLETSPLLQTKIPSLFHLSMSTIVHQELYLYYNLNTILPTNLYKQIPPVYVECLRTRCFFDRSIKSCFT